MARGQKNRTENVMLYCTGNKYENSLIDSQSFTKNRCILQATRGVGFSQKMPHHHCAKLIKGIDIMTNLMQE